MLATLNGVRWLLRTVSSCISQVNGLDGIFNVCLPLVFLPLKALCSDSWPTFQNCVVSLFCRLFLHLIDSFLCCVSLVRLHLLIITCISRVVGVLFRAPLPMPGLGSTHPRFPLSISASQVCTEACDPSGTDFQAE